MPGRPSEGPGRAHIGGPTDGVLKAPELQVSDGLHLYTVPRLSFLAIASRAGQVPPPRLSLRSR
jgi:hypothetical protein